MLYFIAERQKIVLSTDRLLQGVNNELFLLACFVHLYAYLMKNLLLSHLRILLSCQLQLYDLPKCRCFSWRKQRTKVGPMKTKYQKKEESKMLECG